CARDGAQDNWENSSLDVW
nr:immunoglobulin heavy chain junction region [Macaca mulatta]